jgi:diadenosine tetraphosphatase ApaH/serine/threonine PP2A family protein phosphatase
LFYIDPDENVNGWEKMGSKKDNPKHRGSGYLFGKDVLEDFLNENDLDMMCRAHQCVHNGYQWAFDGQVVTIFSAPNYNNRKNFAAVMKVPPGGSVGFQLFRTG